MDALCTYLENRQDLKDISKEMMEAAHRLLAGENDTWLDIAEIEAVQLSQNQSSQQMGENTNTQLRLL
jgi:exonuclease SbcD